MLTLEPLVLPSGEAPLLDQGSLYLLLERVGVLANFQLVYAELAASCSAMAAAVASFHDPKHVQLLSVFIQCCSILWFTSPMLHSLGHVAAAVATLHDYKQVQLLSV